LETQNTVNTSTSFRALMDAEQAAALLGCHPRTLLRKTREGVVPCFLIFGKVRFTEAALAEWVEAQGYNQSAIRAA
jgi:excisionase family DNA binding protein